MAEHRTKVVIVGAGFGGLEAAKALRRAPVDVILIDRQNHHCFQPLLYQVATAALSPADVAWPIRHILRAQRNATVLMEEVTGVDPQRKLLRTDFGELPYDYLIIATGATHSYFGHDEWSAFAPGLKRIEDATRIRRSDPDRLRAAEVTADAAEQRRLLHLRDRRRRRHRRRNGRRHRRDRAADAGRRFPPHRSAQRAHRADRSGPADVAGAFRPICRTTRTRRSTRAGVEVRTDTQVTKCDARGVDIGSGRIDAGTMIWAAGVIASPAARWLDAAADRAGRVKVGPDLSVPGHPEIFVIGDTAAVYDDQGQPVPGMAPAAKQMGQYVGQADRSAHRRPSGNQAVPLPASRHDLRPSAAAPRW